MVQLTVRLVATPGHLDEMVQALVRAVMRPAQQLRGCRFAQVYRWANAPERVDYVEEWDEAGELRLQFRTARFARLLEVLETAAVPPVVEFKDVSGTHGLEFIAAAGTAQGPDTVGMNP